MRTQSRHGPDDMKRPAHNISQNRGPALLMPHLSPTPNLGEEGCTASPIGIGSSIHNSDNIAPTRQILLHQRETSILQDTARRPERAEAPKVFTTQAPGPNMCTFSSSVMHGASDDASELNTSAPGLARRPKRKIARRVVRPEVGLGNDARRRPQPQGGPAQASRTYTAHALARRPRSATAAGRVEARVDAGACPQATEEQIAPHVNAQSRDWSSGGDDAGGEEPPGLAAYGATNDPQPPVQQEPAAPHTRRAPSDLLDDYRTPYPTSLGVYSPAYSPTIFFPEEYFPATYHATVSHLFDDWPPYVAVPQRSHSSSAPPTISPPSSSSSTNVHRRRTRPRRE